MFDTQHPAKFTFPLPLLGKTTKYQFVKYSACLLRLIADLLRYLCDAVNGSARPVSVGTGSWWAEYWSFLVLAAIGLARGQGYPTEHLRRRSPCYRLRYSIVRSYFLVLWGLQPKEVHKLQRCQNRSTSGGPRQTNLCGAAISCHVEADSVLPTVTREKRTAICADEPRLSSSLRQETCEVKRHVHERMAASITFDASRGIPMALMGRGTSIWHQHHTCLRPVTIPKPAHIRRRSAGDVLEMDDATGSSTSWPEVKRSYAGVGRCGSIKRSKPHRRCFSWPEIQREQ